MKRTPLKRGKGLRSQSPKRAAEHEEWRDARMAVAARDGHQCKAETLGWGGACGGPLDPHHVNGRDTAAERLDIDGLVTLCRNHHDEVHNHPREAREAGLLR